MEALAAITGFITWYKWKGSYLKWFPVYLSAITLLEISHRVFESYSAVNNAYIVYEIVIPLEILFINWFFLKTLNKKNSRLVISGACIYLSSLILEKTLLYDKTYYFQSLSYTIGNLFILVYLIIFFIELVRSKNIFNFKKLTVFWICFAMLIFHLGTFPFYGLYNELGRDLGLFIPVAWFATSLNYCMYTLFTIGFIWGKAV